MDELSQGCCGTDSVFMCGKDKVQVFPSTNAFDSQFFHRGVGQVGCDSLHTGNQNRYLLGLCEGFVAIFELIPFI